MMFREQYYSSYLFIIKIVDILSKPFIKYHISILFIYTNRNTIVCNNNLKNEKNYYISETDYSSVFVIYPQGTN